MDDALLLQKYHGLGNDYLVLDPNKNKIHLLERHIVKLCRRNIGAGADGILYGPIWQDEKLYVKIFNPDGSEAERSGNGVRIFAKYLLDAGYIRHRPFSLYTKAGEVRIDFLNEDGSLMKVNMGIPQFTGRRILPCLSTSQVVAPAKKKRENFLASFEVSGTLRNFSSMFCHSSFGYTKRHPSKPFVTTNSSPSCSLNLEGTIILPLASML